MFARHGDLPSLLLPSLPADRLAELSAWSAAGASKTLHNPRAAVPYTVEKAGEGEIFALHRVCFKVPRDRLARLQGGRASIMVRGGTFELTADKEAGTVETIQGTFSAMTTIGPYDNDAQRFRGKGLLKSVDSVEKLIAEKLVGAS